MNKELNNLLSTNDKVQKILEDCPYSVLNLIEVIKFKKNEFYLRKGTISPYVYILVDGLVEIFIENINGRKIVLDIYKPGNFIGEHEIVNKNPFSVSVQSKSEICLLRISRKDFLKWLDLDRNINNRLLSSLCEQIYRLSNLTEVYSLFSTKEQVCFILLKLKSSTGVIERNQILAGVSSSSRSVDRILRDLKEKKIISNINGLIRVLDKKELKKYKEE
ncbi:Crp/Fnr family transcriptional regulator [Vagococcus vulneris]|uniref:Cyclic nucleotide-binding domain-containing protein n=1 Tax=Vagococcus vulneris TaxID=1977869 RepID=A0A429ZWD2_9ENTE|nr:Crp/Fnr family transcriptional regulator [Vagococcus vulneris]RST98130.1 hypothetical protein CBF37_08840 [Vagococcus vulneris]